MQKAIYHHLQFSMFSLEEVNIYFSKLGSREEHKKLYSKACLKVRSKEFKRQLYMLKAKKSPPFENKEAEYVKSVKIVRQQLFFYLIWGMLSGWTAG